MSVSVEEDERERENAARRMMDGSAWSEFCDILKMAGNTILRATTPEDVFTRTEGFRYLTRLTRTALESFVERADPRAPALFTPVHETVKMGSDNPDIHYQYSTLSGDYQYRIRGTRGTIHYLVFGSYVGTYGQGGLSGQTGQLEHTDLAIADDGTFEILLSRDDPRREGEGGNWLPLGEGPCSLIVRQMYLDRSKEQIAELTIERVGGDGKPTPLTALGLDQALGIAGRFVVGSAAMFGSWVDGFMKHTNQLPKFDPEVSLAAHGNPNFVYYHSYWKVAPDEVLLVEVTPPECDSWNFQLNNHWMESLDYRFFNIWVNKATARYRDDGSVRIAVAHEDPGVADCNWLDTAGHHHGTMCFRWCRATEHPQPQARIVKLAELRAGAV